MALRKCQAPSCANNLPAGATARAKYCSGACRERARYARQNGNVATLSVATSPSEPDAPGSAPEVSGSRREALERAVSRLERLLDESDPRSAAPLNKEYRETLRELEALSAAEQQEGRDRDSRNRERRPFSASAI